MIAEIELSAKSLNYKRMIEWWNQNVVPQEAREIRSLLLLVSTLIRKLLLNKLFTEVGAWYEDILDGKEGEFPSYRDLGKNSMGFQILG